MSQSPSAAGHSAPLHRLLSQAADAVQGVREGRSLTDLLAKVPADLRPGAQALAFAALRRLGSAEATRQQLAPKAPPPRVDSLLLVALALLWPDPEQPPAYTDHTLVDQAVNAAKQRAPASANFVNAVLRRFLRERDALLAEVLKEPAAFWNYPAWWIDAMKASYPRQWQTLLAAGNLAPPLTLRVNQRRCTVSDYLARLAGNNIEAQQIGASAVRLAVPVPVNQIAGFADGLVSVQDAAAQLAAPLLDVQAGMRVLDACAAPGGKAAHLLERDPELQLVAVEIDAARLRRMRTGFARLGLAGRGRLLAADATALSTWWDGEAFDAVLLDAPCSATGIVRRQPDVLLHRRESDLDALTVLQARLLDTLWTTVAPRGVLLYATCSILKSENDAQVAAFLARTADASVESLDARFGRGVSVDGRIVGYQRLPGEDGGDGFFYARLRKG